MAPCPKLLCRPCNASFKFTVWLGCLAAKNAFAWLAATDFEMGAAWQTTRHANNPINKTNVFFISNCVFKDLRIGAEKSNYSVIIIASLSNI
jgi:hypothetical protein